MKNNRVIGVIPARYGSSRFPGKVLAEIEGVPMIEWVYKRSKGSGILDDLIVAADDERVIACVKGFGGKAVMTASHHASGTDRIAEVMEKTAADIVVNIQGDQPLIDPGMIDETVRPLLERPDIRMATVKTRVTEEHFRDPGVVKVVTDREGFALYFSRSLIPYPRYSEHLNVFEHVGLYVYRRDFLFEFAKMAQGELEKTESLEQLRVLEAGVRILVVETKSPYAAGVSVDTPEDLVQVSNLVRELGITLS